MVFIFCLECGIINPIVSIAFVFNKSLSLIRKNDINKIEKKAIKILPSKPSMDWKTPVIEDMFLSLKISIMLGSISRFADLKSFLIVAGGSYAGTLIAYRFGDAMRAILFIAKAASLGILGDSFIIFKDKSRTDSTSARKGLLFCFGFNSANGKTDPVK